MFYICNQRFNAAIGSFCLLSTYKLGAGAQTSPPIPLHLREGEYAFLRFPPVFELSTSLLPLPPRGGGWGERFDAGTELYVDSQNEMTHNQSADIDHPVKEAVHDIICYKRM